ncbi:MAG TPA: ATP-dependent protease ATPase subunit HslU [Chloroflexota bacterium]|nr:ATP-dependent protease ATPase subunit HslU [Chloroflexota bacterium]
MNEMKPGAAAQSGNPLPNEGREMDDLTPSQIVEQLNKFVVGQESAKRAMAIALRNRYRRRMLPAEARDDVAPKNILMIGGTGVGKTEIARRVAGLCGAPFVKVEATRFTEVGYVGKDVDSILQELVEAAVGRISEQKMEEVQSQAEKAADERIIDYLCQQAPVGVKKRSKRVAQVVPASAVVASQGTAVVTEAGKEDQPQGQAVADAGAADQLCARQQRSKVARLVRTRRLEDAIIEIEISQDNDNYESVWEFSTGMTQEEVNEGLREFIESYSTSRRKSKRVSVRDARRILTREEANKLVDYDSVVELAVQQAEQSGIVFIDEVDKIAGSGYEFGSDISGEGVQRDLLPVIEGCSVMTRYGPVKSDHVLFIAAGSFSRSKPSDLIPELQGRFPLRVELQPLGEAEMKRVLTEPQNSLLRQYRSLLETEGVELEFSEDGVTEIAATACRMNRQLENIGARRLQTIVEKVLEDISFQAPSMSGQKVVVDAEYVRDKVAKIAANEDLSRYIL